MLRGLSRLRTTSGIVRRFSAGRDKAGGRGKVVDRAGVQQAADRAREHAHAKRVAQWASSWMMPWERAQMDVSSKPLRTWERVYWRLFVVFGTVGLAYETYVLGNCRVLRGGDVADLRTTRTMGGGAVGDALYRSNNALRSHHLMSDEEVDKAHAVVVRAHEWKPEAAVES